MSLILSRCFVRSRRHVAGEANGERTLWVGVNMRNNPYHVWEVARLCDAMVIDYNSVILRFKIDLSPSGHGIRF